MVAKSGFLLLAVAAFAFLASSGLVSAATGVSGCMQLTSADTNYALNRSLLDENVTDQGGWCIGIAAANITLDCQGYSISNGTLAISGIYSNQIDTTIMNCDVSMASASGGNGIELDGADGSLVRNNTLNGQYYGLYMSNTASALIENNTLSSNLGSGLYLTGGSDGNMIFGNDMWNCTSSLECLRVHESESNIFDRNTINKSGNRGIRLSSFGEVNQASHNLFMNTVMANIAGTGVFLDEDEGSVNTNNTFLNCTYNNETVDAGSQLIRKWHYRALVVFPSGESAPGVSLEAFNSSGALIENLTSGMNGWTSTGILTDYVNNGGNLYFHSNYTINVSHPDYVDGSEEYNVTLTKSNLSDVVALGNIYSHHESSLVSRSTWSIGMADLDGDGHPDYIAGNYNQFNSIYINDGTGSFTLTESSEESENTYSIAVGDLDNDGHPDYIAGNYNEPNRVYINDGTGSFIPMYVSDESNATRSIILADLDNDGSLDYIAGNSNQPNQVYINNGTGGFTLVQNSPESESTFTIVVADLDNDGYQDYIAGNYDQYDRIYINNGSGYFSTMGTLSEVDYTRTMSVADLNNDGFMDLITGNGPSPKGNDRVYYNNGSGYMVLNSSTSMQDRTYGLAIADVNNDGDLDYISGNAGPGYNRIYLDIGGGNYTHYEDSLWPNTTNTVAIADLNDDGNLDYISGNTGENHVFLNNRKDDDYAIVLVRGTSPGVSRDAVGTRVGAYSGGAQEAVSLVTAADSSRDGTMELHFGLSSGGTYDINATFITGKIVSCAVTPPVSFTMYQNGSSTNGVSCHVVDYAPDIVSMLPENFHVTSDTDVNFSCSATDDNQLSNISIYVYNSTSVLYYSATEAVTGTSNQSSWFLGSMVPDMYQWNCIVSDNASIIGRQPANYSLRVQIFRSLYVKLVLNNTDSTVYIPGVGEVDSSTLIENVYNNPPHYYLASQLDNAVSGLVFSMRIPRVLSVGRNATAQTHYLSIDQDLESSRVFLVFTEGGWRVIETRMALIEAGRFLTNILPSFSYGLGNRYSLDLALGYMDIDLRGNMRLRKGTHKIVIENNGTSGGKPVVVIGRE